MGGVKHKLGRIIIISLLMLNIAVAADGPTPQASETPSLTEYDWQALYIVKFGLNYVEWPEQNTNAGVKNINVCIFGDSPAFLKSLKGFQEKAAQKLKINIVQEGEGADLNGCNIAYIARNRQNYRELLSRAKNIPVLTVAPIEGFAGNGGILEFIFVDSGKSGAPFSATGNVAFKINNQAATQSKLKIATEALESAKEVIK